jgi:hypothetical protein
MRLRLLAFAWVPFVWLVATDAGAVGTRTFELDTLDGLSGGDLKGVAVSSDGIVRAGWNLGGVPLEDASATWSALALSDGSTLVGTSPEGKVYRVAGDDASLYSDTGTLAVTSLAEGNAGAVFAGTLSEGKIFRLKQGKAELFAALPDTSNVWAIAFDKAKGALYAATGPEGKLFRVDASGASSVYFRSDETNLVSVAVAENGDVLTGSSGKGLLYRVTGPGRATVVFDFPGDPVISVRAIAVAKGGITYAIANEETEAPDPPKRNGSSGRSPAGPVTVSRPKAGKGSLYRFDAQGRPERMMHHDEFHYMALAVDASGQPYVGTGAEGRVYTVNDAHVVTLVADTDERQIGAIALTPPTAAGRGGLGVVAGSDPAVAHRIVGRGGADAVWTSKTLDAGLRARFGVMTWRSSGPLELSTRTGNTSVPDGTWSPWSNPITTAAAVTSPAGRFAQIRARWTRDPNASLEDVVLPFLTENVRPIVLEIGAPARSSRDGRDGIPASGGEPPKHDNVVKVSWKVDDPDSDSLRYRVAFRREGQTIWRDVLPATEVLTKSELDWDTQSLPEGKYRLRVEASDELANPPGDVLKHSLESELVLVDNTPPQIHGLTMTGRKLRGRIVDGLGPIASAEVAVDGRAEWRPIAAADGLFDTADEAIDADLSTIVPAGSHIVAVRAFDAAGNAVVQEIESK